MPHLEDILLILTVSLPTYFFWRWLYNKFIKNKRRNLIATWGSTIVITPVIYATGVYALLFGMCYYPNRTFETQRWIGRPDKRYEMSKNILESSMLLGKTKEQVKAMLGKNDSFHGIDMWTFYMGIPPGFSIDGDVLNVEFKDNKVVKATVVQN